MNIRFAMTSSWIEVGDPEKYSCITTCLALSRTAYANNDQSCLTMLNKQLHKMSHGIEHLQFAKESRVPYLVAYKPHTDEFYVAFRGIGSLPTLLPSLWFAGVPNDFQGRVHAGYLQQAKLIPSSPFTLLLDSNPTCKLIFTGHSLGGAIAAMVTCNILFDEKSIGHHKRISCIAFGAPFFADEQCAVYMNDRFQDRFHFYVNHSDPIPFVFCFVHDCLQRLSSPDQVHQCVRWLEALLGVQEAALTSEDQSKMNSLVSNAPATQFFQAKNMFETATGFLRPILSILKIAVSKYQLFGECYHIVTDTPIDSVPTSTEVITSATVDSTSTTRIVVKSSQNVSFHTKWLSMTPESIINDLIKSYQDHGIRNYISELHTHAIAKYNLGLNLNSPAAQLMSNSTPLRESLPLAKFLPTNDLSRWRHDTNTENDSCKTVTHYWSAVSTDYLKDKKSNISFQFRGPTVCFFLKLQYCERNETSDSLQPAWRDTVRHSSSDEDIVIFEIKKVPTSTKRDMLYRCVHHFGHMDLSKIIDSSQFTPAPGLVGRKKQVADFEIVELYVAALSYVVFNHPSTEETVIEQTTTSDNAVNEVRRKKILDELLLCEQIILTDRQGLEKNLLDTDKKVAQLFKEEVKRIRVAGARFPEPEQPNENNTFIGAETTTFDFRLCSLKSQIDTLSSKSSSQDIITAATPTLVAMSLTITDKLEVEGLSHPSLIGASAGAGAGGVVAGVVHLLGGPMLLSVVLGMSFWVVVGYGVYRGLLTIIDQQYCKMLEYIAKSMGVTMQELCQRPYGLEERISTIYEKTMASYSDQHICDNWKTEFFQHHDLAKISNKQLRLKWLSRLKCVHAHFTMRQTMSEMLTVGVIGVGKAGKSMLIHKMFGFPTRPGAERTTKIQPYPVSNCFQMLDLPHLTSSYDHLKRSFAHSYTMVNGVIVILDAQQQGDDDQGEGHALRTVQQLSMEGVDVLYCFNKSDILVQDFNDGDRLTSATLSDDEDDDDMSNSLSTEQRTQQQQQQQSTVWNGETTKTKISDFADRYKKYGVCREQCKLTFFELNERDEKKRKEIKEHLKSLGILNGADIRNDWLRNLLKDNGFNGEKIEQIIRFRYRN